jgi:hypothetical protein
MKTAASELDLTFSTPNDSGFPFVLFVCVLGSLLAHAATFALFHVVYPERVTIPQPAPQVSLLTPSSPENVALLRWIEAEDPALIANDNPVVPPGLADVRYRPSFASPRTVPLGAPAEPSQGVRFPRAKDRLTTTDASASMPEPLPAAAVEKTSIYYSGALTGRLLAQNPPIVFDYHASAHAEPTTLLLGVNDQGEVRFAVLQRSSGDPGLDALTLAHLRRITFAPAEAPMTWGFATVSWGSDAYSQGAKSP